MAWACSPNAFSAPWLSSSKKCGSFMVFGLNTSLWPFVFGGRLGLWYDVFTAGERPYVFQCLPVRRADITENL